MAKKTTPVFPTIPEIPVRVTVDININHKLAAPVLPARSLSDDDSGGGDGDCPDNKFTYSFDATNATVISLSVEGTTINNPGPSGSFTACVYDATPEPKARVVCVATENNPGGTVALTLKFRGKDMFTPAKDLTNMGDGFLKLNLLAKIPL